MVSFEGFCFFGFFWFFFQLRMKLNLALGILAIAYYYSYKHRRTLYYWLDKLYINIATNQWFWKIAWAWSKVLVTGWLAVACANRLIKMEIWALAPLALKDIYWTSRSITLLFCWRNTPGPEVKNEIEFGWYCHMSLSQ